MLDPSNRKGGGMGDLRIFFPWEYQKIETEVIIITITIII